jgi:SAM-dependent methyltransferase
VADSDHRPAVLTLAAESIVNCLRAALAATGMIRPVDFFEHEKYHALEKHYRGKILDLGSGTGHYSAFLNAQGHSVVAMDIADASEHEEGRPIVFDGHTIPFEDDTFDVVLCMFVLHHLGHQDELLSEMRRVARRTVIVAEDLRENAWDRFWSGAHSRFTDWGHAQRSFRSDSEWQERFQRQGLTVRERITIPRWRLLYYPVLRAVYVLEVEE